MSYQRQAYHAPLTPVSASFDELHAPTYPYSQSTYSDSTAFNSQANLAEKTTDSYEYPPSSSSTYPTTPLVPPRKRSRKKLFIGLGLGLLVLAAAAVIVVYFLVLRPKSGHTSDGSKNSSTSSGPSSKLLSVGGDGSTVTKEDGSTFKYSNKFGGFWLWDPENPYNNGAQPNSWTPPLNQTWDFANNRIYGVNLGGWFVIEPFITPALFEKYTDAVDEYTLSQAMAKDTAGGGLKQLEEHYKTFITEEDIAKIAGAGLNWVRMPVPYWAIETYPEEPFLAKTCWKYIVRAIGWCRKYGIRVNLDLHTAPGSQNANNHSGKGGQVNFLHGPMGIANAQRMLQYIRVYTEFFSQPEYQNVVPMFGIVNEAVISTIGRDNLYSFYYQAHKIVRDITGSGEGKGPFISIHDGFTSLTSWNDFLPGADRFVLDTHPYFSFSNLPYTEPIADEALPGGIWPGKYCDTYGTPMNTSRNTFGPTVGGEFSGGYNDCGKYLKGVPSYKTSYYGDCGFWEDARQWNQTTRDGVKAYISAGMDALGDFFFWTWKIGNSSVSGVPSSPLWSYSLGLDLDYVPKDPRTVNGFCASRGTKAPTFNGQYKPYQTGGAGAGTISPDAVSKWGTWPPATISGADAPYASYTATGSIVSLADPTIFPSAKTTLSGWYKAGDTGPAPTPIQGCQYPDMWNAASADSAPGWTCAAVGRRDYPAPTMR